MGIPTGFSVGMGWEWELKSNSHGSPVCILKVVESYASLGVFTISAQFLYLKQKEVQRYRKHCVSYAFYCSPVK